METPGGYEAEKSPFFGNLEDSFAGSRAAGQADEGAQKDGDDSESGGREGGAGAKAAVETEAAVVKGGGSAAVRGAALFEQTAPGGHEGGAGVFEIDVETGPGKEAEGVIHEEGRLIRSGAAG